MYTSAWSSHFIQIARVMRNPQQQKRQIHVYNEQAPSDICCSRSLVVAHLFIKIYINEICYCAQNKIAYRCNVYACKNIFYSPGIAR